MSILYRDNQILSKPLVVSKHLTIPLIKVLKFKCKQYLITSTFVKEMHILSENLLQNIYNIFNHNQFYILYCHLFWDAPRITCHLPVLDEFKTQVINCLDDQVV